MLTQPTQPAFVASEMIKESQNSPKADICKDAGNMRLYPQSKEESESVSLFLSQLFI